MIRGVIDLAFREATGWVVVDYKTDLRTESELPELVEHYSGQVHRYAQVWSDLTGEPVVERGLYFTRFNRYVEI
jgi:ATP-dependent exoDNAse (exonuclease V) beta subunit